MLTLGLTPKPSPSYGALMGTGFGGPAVDFGKLNPPTTLVVSAYSWVGGKASTHGHVTPWSWDPRPSSLFSPLHLNGQDLIWRSNGGNTFQGLESLLKPREPRLGFICSHCIFGSVLCRDCGSVFTDLQFSTCNCFTGREGPSSTSSQTPRVCRSHV